MACGAPRRAARGDGRRCTPTAGRARGGPRRRPGGARPRRCRWSSARRRAARWPRRGRGRRSRPSARRGHVDATLGPSSASASASGVDREPGATTASVTPARTHSSTTVAAKVACTVMADDPRGARPRLHPDRPVVGAIVDASRPATRSSRRMPGPRRATVWATSWQGARLVADGGRRAYVGYSMGGRLASPSGTRAARSRRGARAGGHHRRHPRRRRARRPPRDGRSAGGVDETTASTPSSSGGWPSRSSPRCHPTRGLDDRRTNTAAGLAASLRLAGTGTQEPLWDRLAELEMPVLLVAGERDEKFAALGRRLAATIGDNARLAVVAGCRSRRPPRAARRVRRACARSSATDVEPHEPQGEQSSAEQQLQARRRLQDGDEVPPVAPATPAARRAPAPPRRSASSATSGPRVREADGHAERRRRRSRARRRAPGSRCRRGARPRCACPRPRRSGCRAGC